MPQFSSIIIGNESLAIQCGEMLLDAGHTVRAVVTRNVDVSSWAKERSLTVYIPGEDLAANLSGTTFDWLLSIANLDLISDEILALPSKGAVNVHDGPLPRYAGLNAPVWALIRGEKTHGIAWHTITPEAGKGDIIAQSRFDITPDDTALTLNTKCYAAAVDSFATVMGELASGTPTATEQDLSQRSYFSQDARPDIGGKLDFNQSAETLSALVRALDHGDYWNPLCCPKFETATGLWLVQVLRIAATSSGKAPGTVISVDDNALTVASATNDVILSSISDCFSQSVSPKGLTKLGDVLPSQTHSKAAAITKTLTKLAPHDSTWRAHLEQITPFELPLGGGNSDGPLTQNLTLPVGANAEEVQTAFAILIARLGGVQTIDLALRISPPADIPPGYVAGWVPLRLNIQDGFASCRTALASSIAQSHDQDGFASDLPARIPGTVALPQIGLTDDPDAVCLSGIPLTLAVADGKARLLGDGTLMDQTSLIRMAARLSQLLEAGLATPATPTGNLPVLPDAEREQLLYDWNDTDTNYDASVCVHTLFEQQSTCNPKAEALAFESESLSYDQLNTRANQVAHTLRNMGVKPGVIVGLHLPRSADLLIAALGILKAGGAYLPMDPAYPAERTALYIESSGVPVIVTHENLAEKLGKGTARTLCLDSTPQIASAPETNPDSGVVADDLVYMLYTSGSTGIPKGVMFEHRNVTNFFAGMDGRIPHDPPGVWLAVTSLSFDISVLELLWTLARGFKIVISGDESRALASGNSTGLTSVGGQGMEFSLFYWGNDDGVGRDKYRLLMEGAKFADQNGFCAVWTPERHFHAFGGPYPNPSVTGAAVAALTENIGVRSGSVVAPLHHTARIAEEWAVIDNLTNGRAGLGIAAGWQPDDFVLRPENTPPENRPAMFDAIRDLRKLWAGEPVEFPRKNGEMFSVLTQPRPVSKTLDIWVTTAGNPDTWREAGTNGTHILTHLLGQSVDEVAGKIAIYHDALREAGHDPDDFSVTLMLHSFVAETRELAREVSEEPMKDYLRAAAGLVKQYATDFLAFKYKKTVSNPFDVKLETLSQEELDGIMDYAFDRYFEESGLFGTVDDCVARAEQLKRIGVTEIACLIDYGIASDQVLDGLKLLAEVLRRSNIETKLAEDDFSIAAQIVRHDVTHMQCTPSMAQMLVMNDEARATLSRLDHMMIGGEALSEALASELLKLTRGHVENMYGPTETTIWSTTDTINAADPNVTIGRPIANTQVYVLDENQQPVPIGVTGELYIGGDGVARGYWQQPDLTNTVFLQNPFNKTDNAARMYRTGDLARWRSDGRLDFLGRADHQIKLRGYRIELGEIETALDACPGVHQSVVMAREDTPGLIQLVAYMTVDTPVRDAYLKALLAVNLPDYMLPAHFITLDAFPLTPNKKIDRKALPAPSLRKSSSALITTEVPSLGTVLQKVAAIWSGLLGVDNITAQDNFFELGGHSLLAVQAHREIRKSLEVPKLSITDIFRFPTLGTLVKTIEEKTNGDTKSDKTLEIDPDSDKTTAARSDAMARRREMRARRQSGGA